MIGVEDRLCYVASAHALVICTYICSNHVVHILSALTPSTPPTPKLMDLGGRKGCPPPHPCARRWGAIPQKALTNQPKNSVWVKIHPKSSPPSLTLARSTGCVWQSRLGQKSTVTTPYTCAPDSFSDVFTLQRFSSFPPQKYFVCFANWPRIWKFFVKGKMPAY